MRLTLSLNVFPHYKYAILLPTETFMSLVLFHFLLNDMLFTSDCIINLVVLRRDIFMF